MIPEGLYVVITQEFCSPLDSLGVLEAVAASGVKMVQLREKSLSKAALYEMAKKYRDITSANDMVLILNDHMDIAMAVGADGVHLGQDDLPCRAARSLTEDLIIGISTHNLTEALAAEKEGASYINIGPIFSTQTKTLAMPPLGLDTLKEVVSHVSIPFTTMGGIKENNLEEVLNAGATRIAVVTEVTQSEDPRETASRLNDKILNYISRNR